MDFSHRGENQHRACTDTEIVKKKKKEKKTLKGSKRINQAHALRSSTVHVTVFGKQTFPGADFFCVNHESTILQAVHKNAI